LVISTDSYYNARIHKYQMLFCPFISGGYIYLVRISEMQLSVFSHGCFLNVLMHKTIKWILLHEHTGLQAKKFGINMQTIVTELHAV